MTVANRCTQPQVWCHCEASAPGRPSVSGGRCPAEGVAGRAVRGTGGAPGPAGLPALNSCVRAPVAGRLETGTLLFWRRAAIFTGLSTSLRCLLVQRTRRASAPQKAARARSRTEGVFEMNIILRASPHPLSSSALIFFFESEITNSPPLRSASCVPGAGGGAGGRHGGGSAQEDSFPVAPPHIWLRL